MSRICLVDSGSCARASRSLQMHRGYWHYPWYFDTKVPYNYIPIVILHISTERILGSGSCKTSCTKLKKVKNFTRATPLRSKTPNIVQRDMQIRVALCSSFGPKLIWTATGAPPRPNSEILPCHTVPSGTLLNLRHFCLEAARWPRTCVRKFGHSADFAVLQHKLCRK